MYSDLTPEQNLNLLKKDVIDILISLDHEDLTSDIEGMVSIDDLNEWIEENEYYL